MRRRFLFGLFNILVIVTTGFFSGALGQQKSSNRIDYRSYLKPLAHHKVLVFSKTAGFRHASIQAGIDAITSLGAQHDFAVDATEDASVFNDVTLAEYQCVVFLNTTGDVLNNAQQEAFERYMQGGNGFVGIHSAADTEYGWPWYGGLVGAYFQSHPAIQQATIKVADRVHPSMESLPARWIRTDEWYNFQSNPRGTVHVLATIDENTYAGGENGHDHPIAWCHEYDGGRAWYTAGGHTIEAYSEPLFLEHILGGIEFAAGIREGDCGATIENNFEKVILDDNTENPMELAVAPDGRVFYIERSGTIKVYKPANSQVVVAGQIAVSTSQEDGLIGITLDPDFANNQWLYLFYSPAGPIDKQHVSRFTVVGDALDRSSEKILLEIPTQREQCCHSGGSLAFGPNGELFIATGDNTNPFASDGYTPIDERPGRSAWDAQRTSGNRNDLRGKILRIIPQPDGTYTIPEGNLFPVDGSAGLPEIYVMGCRNPFRISVDRETGWLYWGDVGPDAGGPNPNRGPQGYDEWNQAREAGNFGWPYCIGNNQAYRDYNFATNTSGDWFDCNAPLNDSPNNTGELQLPPARDAMIWYPYGFSTEFPEITVGPGRTAMAGPVYHFDPDLQSETKLPGYYDNTLFIYEWSRSWIKEVKFDENGDLLKINPFLPGFEFIRPMDMEIGPDGSIYILEWGTGFGGNNEDSKLVRINYISGNRAPVAIASATPSSGPVPLTVQFSSEGTFDPDAGDVLTYQWSFEGDGVVNSTDPNPQHTYLEAGNFTAQLTVTDQSGNQAVANVPIIAGNTTPVVTIQAPVNGGFYDWGEAIDYRADAVDAEDGSTVEGSIPCSAVIFQPFIGHDSHAHPLDEFANCEGSFATAEGHGDEGDNIFYVVEARYTDNGMPPVGALTGRAGHILQPKRKQAEHFTTNNGVQVENTGDILGGGENIGFIDHGDYVSFYPMNLLNINFITYRVASAGPGGQIEVRVDAPDGPLISKALVEPTGEWQVYRDVTVPITHPGGTHELFFVFLNNPGNSGLFNVNWIDFHGDGIATVPAGAPDGLSAVYYSNIDFTGDTRSRIDPMVNFNWGTGAPISGIASNTYSVRWSGQVEAPSSESFTFYTRTDEGVRLWVNDVLVIDKWIDQEVTEWASAPIQLTAGERYNIKMEYFEDRGPAQAHLLWSSASTPKQTIPRQYLYSQSPTAIEDPGESNLPERLNLHPAFPNPFNGQTQIPFDVPQTTKVRLEIFDLLGKSVTLLLDEKRPAGSYTINFDASALASGVYLYRLSTPTGSLTRRMVLIK